MKWPEGAPSRLPMAGRYYGQCPKCRTGRNPGPDCYGEGHLGPRRMRRIEKAALRPTLEAPPDVPADEDECIHGCVGAGDEPCRVPVCLLSCHLFKENE